MIENIVFSVYFVTVIIVVWILMVLILSLCWPMNVLYHSPIENFKKPIKCAIIVVIAVIMWVLAIPSGLLMLVLYYLGVDLKQEPEAACAMWPINLGYKIYMKIKEL